MEEYVLSAKYLLVGVAIATLLVFGVLLTFGLVNSLLIRIARAAFPGKRELIAVGNALLLLFVLLFILSPIIGVTMLVVHIIRTEHHKVAEKAVAAANKEVTKAVDQAETLIDAGQLDRAEHSLREAMSIEDATNVGTAKDALVRVAQIRDREAKRIEQERRTNEEENRRIEEERLRVEAERKRKEEHELAEKKAREERERAEQRREIVEAEKKREQERELAEKKAREERERKERWREIKEPEEGLTEKKLTAISPVLGHWRTHDGQELYIDTDRHIIVDDGKQGALEHVDQRTVVFPKGGRLDSLSSEQQRDLGKLLKRCGDVSLRAFSERGAKLRDHPGAVFFVIDTKPYDFLDDKIEVTEIIAVINGRPREAEWVRLLTLNYRTVSQVQRLTYVDRRRTPN